MWCVLNAGVVAGKACALVRVNRVLRVCYARVRCGAARDGMGCSACSVVCVMRGGALLSPPVETPHPFPTRYAIPCPATKIFSGDLKWDRAAVKAEQLSAVTRQQVLKLLDGEMLTEGKAKRVSMPRGTSSALLGWLCCPCGNRAPTHNFVHTTIYRVRWYSCR